MWIGQLLVFGLFLLLLLLLLFWGHPILFACLSVDGHLCIYLVSPLFAFFKTCCIQQYVCLLQLIITDHSYNAQFSKPS